jgi:hypothetical protein
VILALALSSGITDAAQQMNGSGSLVTVAPMYLLPDANRIGFTAGYGWSGQRLHADFALLYVKFQDRATTVNRDNFNGEYKTSVWLLGATLGF